MSNINFAIRGKAINATKLITQARNFTFIADEPPALGGNDEGPNPVEYLLGSYAGCLNVVINLVAKELNIIIHKLQIDIDGDIDPARFTQGITLNRAGFQNIHVKIDIETNSNREKELELIDKSKSRCPINDNLSNETNIHYFFQEKVNLN